MLCQFMFNVLIFQFFKIFFTVKQIHEPLHTFHKFAHFLDRWLPRFFFQFNDKYIRLFELLFKLSVNNVTLSPISFSLISVQKKR